MTHRLLTLCKVIDKRLWGYTHPLRQFPNLSHVVLNRLEEKKLSVDKLKEMRKDEIGKTPEIKWTPLKYLQAYNYLENDSFYNFNYFHPVRAEIGSSTPVSLNSTKRLTEGDHVPPHQI